MAKLPTTDQAERFAREALASGETEAIRLALQGLVTAIDQQRQSAAKPFCYVSSEVIKGVRKRGVAGGNLWRKKTVGYLPLYLDQPSVASGRSTLSKENPHG